MDKKLFKKLLPVIILIAIIIILLIVFINVKKSKNNESTTKQSLEAGDVTIKESSFEDEMAKTEKEFSVYKVIKNADGTQSMKKEKVKIYGTIQNLFDAWKKENNLTENTATILAKELNETDKTFTINFDSELLTEAFDMPEDLHYESLESTINDFFFENGYTLSGLDITIDSYPISIDQSY